MLFDGVLSKTIFIESRQIQSFDLDHNYTLGMGGAPIRWSFDKRANELATASGDAASEINKYILEAAKKNETALRKELGIDLDEVDAIAWTRFMGSIATRFEVVIKNN